MPAAACLVGESPYPAVDPDARHRAELRLSAPFALVLAPFALLPYAGAAALWPALTVGSILGALRLVGVSDWRLYGLAFLFPWTLNGIWVGAITPLLVLGSPPRGVGGRGPS